MPYKNIEDSRINRRKWWANLSAERRIEIQAKATARATKLRRYLDNIKVSRGCIDCGYNKHAAALDFDHVSGEKSILVSFAKSKARADEEILKCEVRCANCHRIVTWQRKQPDYNGGKLK